MQIFPVVGSSLNDPNQPSSDDQDQPFLQVDGVAGTSLRATMAGLLLCQTQAPSTPATDGCRSWSYAQLPDVRLDAYGPIGVIRARINEIGTDLPLLMLEPHQITAARRSLEIIANLISSVRATEIRS